MTYFTHAPSNDLTMGRAPHTKRTRRFLLWSLVLMVVSVIGYITWLGYSATHALSQISDSSDNQANNVLSFLKEHQDRQDELLGEADGRINVLLLGIGGKNHNGGQLSDTIMIASILPKEGKFGMLSVPRDLYVPIPGHGSGKINSAHAYGEQKQSGSGPTLAKQTVSTVLGIPIHYYVRIDFDGFVKLVDALGGLDVNVDKAIYDPYYPDKFLEGYEPFSIKAGQQHLTGAVALKYARSRETTSDFDRARRQQQLIGSFKDKLLSFGVIANPKKLSDLFTIAGAHVKTDMSIGEMERFLALEKNLDFTSAVSKVLDTSSGGPLTSRTEAGLGYIIVPRAGNFSEVQKLAQNLFTGDAADNVASITIQNASGVPQLGGNIAILLRNYGYRVASITDVKTVRENSKLIEQKANTHTDTQLFLSERFHVTPEVGETGTGNSDFLLIIGKDYSQLVAS